MSEEDFDPISLFPSIKEMVVVEREKWLAENIEKIPQMVADRLEGAIETITAQMLGMSNRWGKWEIDHTNNRVSPIGESVKAKMQYVGERLVHDYLDDITLTRDQIKGIQDSYRQSLEHFVKRAATARAEKDAYRIVDEIAHLND